MTTPRLFPLSLVLCMTACPGDDPDGDGGDTESTTSGSSGDNPNPSAPMPADDSSGGDGTVGVDTGTTSDEPTDDGSGDTTGDEVPVDELPFGGYVTWAVQDLIAFGDADFYEIEYPDDPDYEPWSWELPLGPPRAEDEWHVLGTEPGGGGGGMTDEPTIVDLDVGPQLFVDGTDASFTMEFDPDSGTWDMGFVDLAAEYAGGPWAVEIPGNEMFPGVVFADVLPGPANDAAQFAYATDADGIPTELNWTPQPGSHEVSALMAAVGVGGDVQPMCIALLTDDGSAAIPADCVGEGAVPIAEGSFLFLAVIGHEFHADVAYAGHRLRIQAEVNTQLNLPLPFGPR